jgi:predicted DNA-binding transcriptional regulator AlpA
VRARYGDVSDMWLHRRLRDSDFPKPLVINGRRFWRISDLEAWEAKLHAPK